MAPVIGGAILVAGSVNVKAIAEETHYSICAEEAFSIAWRAFAIKVDPNICRNILDLPLKDGKSTKMLDRYICRLGYDTNIKIRDKDLKLKNLHDKTHEGIERWTTEIYNFPISAAIFTNITKSLNLDLPERAIRDAQELISILSKVTPSVQIISVQKR